MKSKLMLLIIIMGFSVFAGCSKNYIDMSYIKEPTSITLVGDRNKIEIDKIKENLKELKQNSNTFKDQRRALIGEMGELMEQASVQITDKEFIDKLMTEIKKDEGITLDSGKYESNNAIYDMQLRYDGINNSEEKMKEGYLPNIYVYSDGTAVTVKYDSNSGLTAVKITLDKDTMNYIKEYYETHLKN